VKKIILFLVISCVAINLLSFEKWELYTNNSHIYQTIMTDNRLISASWGGIEEYEVNRSNDKISLELREKYSTITGLPSNEVREIYLRGDKLWAGTYNDGVTILGGSGTYVLNSANGLNSNKVKAIKSGSELVFVATEGGFSTFYDLEDISFPILSRKYSSALTLGALLSDDINDLLIHNGYVFIATKNGVNYFPESSLDDFDTWQNFTMFNSELANNHATKLAVIQDKLVIAGLNKIQVVSDIFNSPTWETYTIADTTVTYPFVTALSTIPNGEILYSTGKWDESVTTMSELSSTILNKLTSQGVIEPVLTTQTPVYKLNSNDNSPFYLDKIAIKNIEQTDEQIILSTWGLGILIFRNNTWYQYEPNGIGFNAINYLKVDNNNKLWASCGYYGTGALRKGARGVSSFDGENWQTFNMANSPIQSDNISSITVGSDNKKWFGSWYASANHPQGWSGGMTAYDESLNTWRLYHSRGVFDYDPITDDYTDRIPGIDRLPSETISYLNTDMQGNIIASLQAYGVAFYSPTGDKRLAISPLYGSVSQFTRLSFHNEYGYFFGKAPAAQLGESAGLLHWNSQSLPQEGNIADWENIPVPEIRNGYINAIVNVPTAYGTQMWVASNNGLYMYDGTNWYRYGVNIKREKWQAGWKIDIRYFVGETKLFASKETFPRALALDGYGCLWIGTEDAGLTKYDTSSEEFFNYDKNSYPLISNQITALAYEPHAGKLYIGAAEGLCSVTVGSTINKQKDFNHVVVVPNPFYPDRGDKLRIFNHPTNVMPSSAKTCKIFDISGQLVYDLPLDKYQSFSWNGNNLKGKKCSSGVYFYTISNSNGETTRGKIALIRD